MKLHAGVMLLLGVCCWGPGVVVAADVPKASADDTRIRVVRYQPQNVTKIFVRRGVVTRIVLEEGEKIIVSAIGLSSECKSTTDEWCISAEAGGNQIFVRPRDGARSNNMEVRTNNRDYSMEFEVVGDGATSSGLKSLSIPAFYRVIFDYRAPKPAASALSPERAEAVEKLKLALNASAAYRSLPTNAALQKPSERLQDEPIGMIRNANYGKQVLPDGADAEPSAVFDDGRFTYFEFTGAREIPAIFAHGSDGAPTRVNWHMQAPFVVVQQTAKKFTLRLGGAVVGIFNNAFDSVGIETPTNTVSDLIQRVLRKGVPQ